MKTLRKCDVSNIARLFGRWIEVRQQSQLVGDVAMFPPTGSGEIARRFLGSLTHGT